MKKEIKRTIQIRTATVEFRIIYCNREIDADGYRYETDEIVKVTEIKLVVGGKVIAKSSENFIRVIDSEKARFGDKYIPANDAKIILGVLAEMHEELSRKFDTKTPEEERAERAEKAEVQKQEWAKRIMKEVEERKTEILSAEQEKAWRKNYNDAINEGGEGYVPQRITLEDVEKAKRVLGIS